MKRCLFVAVPAIFLILSVCSMAQYPNYEPINPYSRPIAKRVDVEQHYFDEEYNSQCIAQSQCSLESTENALKITSTGGDPYIILPVLASAAGDAPLSGPIEITLRLRATTSPEFEIFWMSPEEPGTAADRFVRFFFENDWKWREYTVRLNIPTTLTRIRIDPGTSKGECEIEWIKFTQNVLEPLEITKMDCNDQRVMLEVTNHNDKPVSTVIQADGLTGGLKETKLLPPGSTSIALAFPKNRLFETMTARIQEEGTSTWQERVFTVFHPELLASSMAEMIAIGAKPAEYPQSTVRALFTKEGTGAVVVESTLAPTPDGSKAVRDRVLATIHSFARNEPMLPFGYAPSKSAPPGSPVCDSLPIGNLPLELVANTSHSVTFASAGGESDENRPVKSITFQLEGDELVVERDSCPLFGPFFSPMGNMEQAILSGIEYLQRGEHSSSIADMEIPEHLRYASDPLHLTMPLMIYLTDRVSTALFWENHNPWYVPIFATPDFLEGRPMGDPLQNKMGIYGGTYKNQPLTAILQIKPAASDIFRTSTEAIIIEPVAVRSVKDNLPEALIPFPAGISLEDAILWGVKKNGVPALPPSRPLAVQRQLNLDGLTKSILRTSAGWHHAVVPGMTHLYPASFGSDMVSVIWQLSGQMPEVPHLALGGAHISNYLSFLLMNKGEELLNRINPQAAHVRSVQRNDGSFLYAGKYQKGHWEDTASGHCGNSLFLLFEHWRTTGNPESLASALRGTDLIKRFKTPRGAQVWEMPLHTPDVMGSSRCCIANTVAYEATGKQEYLDEARRWAITGLPFVYLWETAPLNGDDNPVMLYATTGVLGATEWIAPNWIGLPVQWCGLDYAEALYRFAPHDDTLPWKQIADGILISAEQQQMSKGETIGLLPDSWNIRRQHPNPSFINPCTLEQLRRRLMGETPTVWTVIEKNVHVVSPYPTRIEGDNILIQGATGTTYQILINGQIRSVQSQGDDIIAILQ